MPPGMRTPLMKKVGVDCTPRLAPSAVSLFTAGSTEASLKSVFTGKVRGGNRAGAEALGKVIADRLKDKGITPAEAAVAAAGSQT